MKIYTDELAYTNQLRVALYQTTTGVALQRCNPVGSRKRKHAYDVALESDGTPDQHGAARRRRRNVGTARNVDRFSVGFAASYADWGHFLSRLFELDPNAICGPYNGREDFHAKTNGAFHAPLFETIASGTIDIREA